MNPIIDVIEKRRSVRAYADRPIGQDEKQAIFQAALRAPTAGNMMLYSIIEVDDPAMREELAITCDNQPFIAKAPLVLLFLADFQRWWDYFKVCGCEERAHELSLRTRKPGVGDLMLASCDTLIAAQNAVIAAESFGIGSCYVGDILERYEIHRKMFDLPRYVFPLTLLCFGYPAENLGGKRSKRFDQQYVISKNTYHHLNTEELQAMFHENETRFAQRSARLHGAQNFGQAMYLRKYISAFSVEMTRSVQLMLKNWEAED